jgi:outer membrane lipoprotein-sorting protein
MKCPNAESWELLAIDALDGAEAEALRSHAQACEACRETLLAARRAHGDRMRAYEAFDHDHDRFREQLLARLPAEPPEARRGAGRMRRFGEIVMKINTSATRRAAALLLPAACVAVAVMFLLPQTQRSAFAAAVEKLRTAQTIVCKFEAYMNDGETPLQSGTMHMCEQRGMRFDASMPAFAGVSQGDAMISMVHPKDGPVTMLQPMLKLALRMNVPAGLQDLSGPLNQSTPDTFLNGFRKLTGEADARLGRSKIGDVEAEGFEVHADKLGLTAVGGTQPEGVEPAVARLWVDAQTYLPVQMEIEVSQGGSFGMGAMRVRVVMSQFEFDKALDDSLFVLSIPDTMKLVELTIPAPSEETLIAALQLYAELNGFYPPLLDASQLSAEIAVRMARSGQIKIDPQDPASVMSGELMEKTMTVAIGCTFAQQLQREGRNVEWFGDAVSPGEPDAVLMRWNQPDGGTRVIYGDLRTETIR